MRVWRSNNSCVYCNYRHATFFFHWQPWYLCSGQSQSKMLSSHSVVCRFSSVRLWSVIVCPSASQIVYHGRRFHRLSKIIYLWSLLLSLHYFVPNVLFSFNSKEDTFFFFFFFNSVAPHWLFIVLTQNKFVGQVFQNSWISCFSHSDSCQRLFLDLMPSPFY